MQVSEVYCPIQNTTTPFKILPPHSEAYGPIQKSRTIQNPTTPFRSLEPHSKSYYPIQKSRAPFKILPPHSEVYGPIQKSTTPFKILLPHSEVYGPIQFRSLLPGLPSGGQLASYTSDLIQLNLQTIVHFYSIMSNACLYAINMIYYGFKRLKNTFSFPTCAGTHKMVLFT